MKTITTFGFAAIALGLASLTAPASAAAPVPAGIAQSTDISARTVIRRTVIRRAPVCTVRTVVRRGPMGRRIVSKTKVCR